MCVNIYVVRVIIYTYEYEGVLHQKILLIISHTLKLNITNCIRSMIFPEVNFSIYDTNIRILYKIRIFSLSSFIIFRKNALQY